MLFRIDFFVRMRNSFIAVVHSCFVLLYHFSSSASRKLMGENKIIGATAKTVPWAKEAYEQGADYLGVGAIYPTTTKVVTVLTSTETLDAITKAVPIPVNAIGGLNKDNIDVLKGIDISGVCVVSAIMKSDDPEKAARELKARARELGLC